MNHKLSKVAGRTGLWRAWFCGLALLLLAQLMLAPPSGAQAADGLPASGKITLRVMVSHISNQPGPIDKRASQLHAKISKDFRYESLRVLEEKTMRLGINDVGSMKLPTGRRLRVTPMVVDARGALLAVDLEGSAKADLRVKNRHLIVIGAESYQDGKLLISLSPEF